jgi:hypothetical protein
MRGAQNARHDAKKVRTARRRRNGNQFGRLLLWVVAWPLGLWRLIVHGNRTDRTRMTEARRGGTWGEPVQVTHEELTKAVHSIPRRHCEATPPVW